MKEGGRRRIMSLPWRRPSEGHKSISISTNGTDTSATVTEDLDCSKHSLGDFADCEDLPTVFESELGPTKPLGEGEFCSVVLSDINGRPVAVKVLKEKSLKNETARRDLEQEIKLLGMISHKNVLKPIARGQRGDSPMLIMPVIGRMLNDELPKPLGTVSVWQRRSQCKAWPLSRALKCGLELGEALLHCHHYGLPGCLPGTKVLHRDVKPSNIGFLDDGRLVLFDFGLAKIWKAAPDDTETRHLTGQTGSLRYMAPEVALFKPYNHRAEVFSFATCLWQMCSHEVPFIEYDVSLYMERVVKGEERPKMGKKWSPVLKQLLQDCWKSNHEERPDFTEIVPSLQTMVSGLQMSAQMSALKLD